MGLVNTSKLSKAYNCTWSMSEVRKDGSLRSKPSDLAALWMAALTDYYKTSGLDLSRVPRYSSFNEIMRDRSVQKGFEKVSPKINMLCRMWLRDAELTD